MNKLNSSDEQRLSRARKAMVERRFENARKIYEALHSKYPNQPSIGIEFAQCLVRLGEKQKACQTLTAVEPTINSGKDLAIVCRTYDSIQDSASALRVAERALQFDMETGTEVYLRTVCAFGCERQNRLAEAELHCKFLLKHDAKSQSTQLIAGLLASRRRDWNAAEEHLRPCLDGNLPVMFKSKAGFELAKVYDKQGQYERAMEVLRSVKSMDLPCAQNTKQIAKWVATTTLQMTKLVDEHRGPLHEREEVENSIANSSVPTGNADICLLTGHPRSGTTLLEQILDRHEMIRSADESSSLIQSVFSKLVGQPPQLPDKTRLLLEQTDPNQLESCYQDYYEKLAQLVSNNQPFASDGQNLDSSSDVRWLIDKNPEAVILIPSFVRTVPRPRVIIMLRDPRDVVLSCYSLFLPINPVSINYRTLEMVSEKYVRTMQLWLALRQKLPVPSCEIRYEELVSKPRETTRRVFKFLDVPVSDKNLAFSQYARSKTIKSPSYNSVVDEIHQKSVGRWKNYARYVEPVLPILWPIMEQLGYDETGT